MTDKHSDVERNKIKSIITAHVGDCFRLGSPLHPGPIADAIIATLRPSEAVESLDQMREALLDIRNRILCPVGPAPTLEDIQAIASAALSEQPIPRGPADV